jgi:hypothetical protein
MKCVEADIENNIPCKVRSSSPLLRPTLTHRFPQRCRAGNLNCVFEESLRGKKSNRGKKSEAMAKSLKKMEETLHTVGIAFASLLVLIPRRSSDRYIIPNCRLVWRGIYQRVASRYSRPMSTPSRRRIAGSCRQRHRLRRRRSLSHP